MGIRIPKALPLPSQAKASQKPAEAVKPSMEKPENVASPVLGSSHQSPKFTISRPARLLAVMWLVSLPVVMIGRINRENLPMLLMIELGGVVALGIALALAWVAYNVSGQKRSAANGVFGGLSVLGVCANVLVGVFSVLVTSALRDLESTSPSPHMARDIVKEIEHAKDMYAKVDPPSEEPKFAPAIRPVPTLRDSTGKVLTSLPTPAKPEVKQQPAPAPVITPIVPPKPETIMVGVDSGNETSLHIPSQGVKVRRGTAPDRVSRVSAEEIDRLSMEWLDALQARIAKAEGVMQASAKELAQLRDPLLYTTPAEFRLYRDVLARHTADATALHDLARNAPEAYRQRLAQLGASPARIARMIEEAFPSEQNRLITQERGAYVDLLLARADRSRVLREFLGRWRYEPNSQELWLADDQVRDECQAVFEDVRVASMAYANLRAINAKSQTPAPALPTVAGAEGDRL